MPKPPSHATPIPTPTQTTLTRLSMTALPRLTTPRHTSLNRLSATRGGGRTPAYIG